MFLAQDAGAVRNILHTDIVADKDVRVNDVDAFLKRFPARSLQFKEAVIEERFTSEDGKTDRIRSALRFTGPVLAPQYPDRSVLNLTLLWVMEDNKWWLERPLKVEYTVNTTSVYPTPLQEESAQRFLATLAILDKLGLPGNEDLQLRDPPHQGTAIEQYKELENLYRSEKGREGVDPKVEAFRYC